jgi:hypothetical protein
MRRLVPFLGASGGVQPREPKCNAPGLDSFMRVERFLAFGWRDPNAGAIRQ